MYNFIYSVSTIDHNKHKTLSILNIDRMNNDLPETVTHNHNYNTPSSIKSGKEYSEISTAISRLKQNIVRYRKYGKYIWKSIFIPFIESNDCVTMKYLSKNDYWIFKEFMEEQTLYKAMVNSLDQLKLY